MALGIDSVAACGALDARGKTVAVLGSGVDCIYPSAHKKLAEENMKKLDILPLKKKCYRELSGGQQQRVLLARALCSADKLILLDEPVTGLDPVVTAEFYALLKKLNRDYGITVIMVSHDLFAAVNNASHILHLRKNNSFFGSVEEYIKSDIYKKFSGGDVNE